MLDKQLIFTDFSITQEELYIEKSSAYNYIGNRVVNLGFLLSWATKLQFQHAKICSAGTLVLKNESRRGLGLTSLLIFECDTCEKQVEHYTDDPSKKSAINYGAVWGTLTNGSTYGHLRDLLAHMDIPSMTQYKFQEIEKELGEVLYNYNCTYYINTYIFYMFSGVERCRLERYGRSWNRRG